METPQVKEEPSGEVIEVPASELSEEFLVSQGMDSEVAKEAVEYANLFTGSNRVVNDEFLEMFRQKGADLLQQHGVSVKHRITEIDPTTGSVLRKIYVTDWDRVRSGVEVFPRGHRRAITDDLRNQPIFEKKFVITAKKNYQIDLIKPINQ